VKKFTLEDVIPLEGERLVLKGRTSYKSYWPLLLSIVLLITMEPLLSLLDVVLLSLSGERLFFYSFHSL